MPDATACCKCGSTDIIPAAQVIDRGRQGYEGPLELRVDADPKALLFKEAERSSFCARVCGQCGYTELYALHAVSLLEGWRRSQSSQG